MKGRRRQWIKFPFWHNEERYIDNRLSCHYALLSSLISKPHWKRGDRAGDGQTDTCVLYRRINAVGLTQQDTLAPKSQRATKKETAFTPWLAFAGPAHPDLHPPLVPIRNPQIPPTRLIYMPIAEMGGLASCPRLE